MRLCRTTLAAALLPALAACASNPLDVNPFDRAQVPAVTVRPGPPPVVAWTPGSARTLRVYRGASAGDGYTPELVWYVDAAEPNGLRSPIVYGEAPAGSQSIAAPALVSGQAYTALVIRDDSQGSGEGPFNTRNTYEGTATFVP